MLQKPEVRPYVNRLVITVLISVVFVLAFNEITYLFQKDQTDRPPKIIQLVIPAGTAERVAAGESVPSIPEEMVFVVGDTLEVKNEDDTSHQLGPLWIPPRGVSRLTMEQAEQLAYSCSFQSTSYLGVDIRQPTTLATRITALLLAAPTLAALLYIYGLLVFPIKPPIKAVG